MNGRCRNGGGSRRTDAPRRGIAVVLWTNSHNVRANRPSDERALASIESFKTPFRFKHPPECGRIAVGVGGLDALDQLAPELRKIVSMLGKNGYAYGPQSEDKEDGQYRLLQCMFLSRPTGQWVKRRRAKSKGELCESRPSVVSFLRQLPCSFAHNRCACQRGASIGDEERRNARAFRVAVRRFRNGLEAAPEIGEATEVVWVPFSSDEERGGSSRLPPL